MLVVSLFVLGRLFQRFWCAKRLGISMKIREEVVIFCAGYNRDRLLWDVIMGTC